MLREELRAVGEAFGICIRYDGDGVMGRTVLFESYATLGGI